MALCDDLGGWDRGVVRRRLERGRIHTHTHTHTHIQLFHFVYGRNQHNIVQQLYSSEKELKEMSVRT